MSALLRMRGVIVRRQQREILHGIALDFVPGTVTALVGPNGAGKSTLLAVAAGDLRPDAGEVLLQGRPLAGYTAGALARERAVMPQEHGVRFAFSVEEVVAMGRLPHPPDPVVDDAQVEQAIDAAELQALRLREVQQLSGGESARTTFARVLAQQTPLLLLDEPTAALDLRHQERTLRSVRSWWRRSSAAVGSSKSSNGVCWARTRAKVVRADSPPDNCCTSRRRRACSSAASMACSTCASSTTGSGGCGKRPIATTSSTLKANRTPCSCGITARSRANAPAV